LKLDKMKPVILWVDDKPQNVEHLIETIQEEQKSVVFHKGSTREARAWLTSDIGALSPTLKVITDNHRDELDEEGEMQSNFDAGSQLIEWLNVQSQSFHDAQILMFCGAGSLPYVRALKTKYSNVEITVNEGSVLKWVRDA